MNKHINIWVLTLATIMFTSCYDSVDNSIVVDTDPDTPTLITTAITGSVVDADNNELTNYQLSAGNLLENIESKRFLIQLENVNKKGQAIYVKDGSQITSMLHTPLLENDINLIRLQLFNPMNSSLISSSDPDRIDISPNTSILIVADEVRDAQGNIPTQDVYVDYRDLSSLNNIAQLGVSAYSASEQLLSTQHINAFHVELRGDNGDAYSIGESIEVNISLIENTTKTALFHFDMEDEKWKEITQLQKGNNSIQITKTGLYTVSKYSKGVYAQGDVNKEGVKVSYQLMSLDQRHINTTANGRWITTIPADQDILISTLTPCKNDISTYTVPASNIDINNIDIEVINGNYYKLQSTVYDCNGELEETTAISIDDRIDIHNVYTFSDKNIDTWVSVCDAEFDIATYDIDTDIKGTIIPWSSDIKDDQSFLVSCEEFQDGYSYIKIKNDKRVLPPFDAIKIDDGTTLQSSDSKIRFKFKGQMVNNYDMKDVNVYLEDPSFGTNGYRIACENTDEGCGFTTWNVTHYEAGSEKWVRVSFAGEVWMQTLDPPQAGYFPVEGVILTKAE